MPSLRSNNSPKASRLPQRPLDLAAARQGNQTEAGRHFWRSLEQLAAEANASNLLSNEPSHSSASESGVSRRDLLRLMGASAAFAGLTACTKLPREKIVPYVNAPEDLVPGQPLFYATAMTLGGYATGLLVESHMGRPTKVEGNPDHPASLGATDLFAQASVLTLYDPDRSKVVIYDGRIGAWSSFLTAMTSARAAQAASRGVGLRILTPTVTSPTLADQLQRLLAQYPEARWHQYEPCGRDNAREGARLAFGEYVNTIYRFDRAAVVLSLDADFLCQGPGSVRYARDFADRRAVTGPQSEMNRLYVVECALSSTGVVADHRLPVRAGEVVQIAQDVASRLGVKLGEGRSESSNASRWIQALVRDLQQHRGSSLVLAGEQQPPLVHALAHAMNHVLGNVGSTVIYTYPVEAHPVNQLQSLKELVADIQSGRVEMIVILGGNPVYDAPVDLNFGQTLLKVPLRVHLGLYEDETAELCHWHVPQAHYLESWSDARAYDGTISIIQPLISPLYEGKTAHELLAVLMGQEGATPHDIVHDYWKERTRSENFDATWETWLNNGFIPNSALPAKAVTLQAGFAARLQVSPPQAGGGSEELEIVFRPDPTVWDGSFANNGWLQEVPKPITKLTWDNAALISIATAERLGVTNQDVVRLTWRGRQVQAPVWIMPGHADGSVTVHLGYGRRRAGSLGTGLGFNAYLLRPSDQLWSGLGLQVEKTGESYLLANTQSQFIINAHGRHEELESIVAARRDLVRVATLAEFRKNPNFALDPPEQTTRAPSLYPNFQYEGYSWGMLIDLNRCVGCNACVVACQAENNVAVVGKDQVSRGRIMHWIRIDTYFDGDVSQPLAHNQPLLCMQCENAPCEEVCPVGATVHSPEGLNEMIYNRCVGTRYCSNNCPYKVRRFNFYLYSDWTTASFFGLRNPDVTVRSRGVMEKCTYCVQRINRVKIQAEEQNRTIRDGEILTACQQACPSQAIVFGNINDPGSRVAQLKALSRNYGLLTDLNTRPRTTYLARVRNPNPEIET